jgi:hypothetical protein
MSVRPTCPICRRLGPLTNEDIFPTWLRKEVLSTLSEGRTQAPPRIKVRICETCNKTMGQKFEQTAAPLLKTILAGEALSLTPKVQQVLSAWLTKTALLGCLAGSRAHLWGYHLLGTLIDDLIRTGLPPVQTVVRIGATNSQYSIFQNLLPEASRMPKYYFFSSSVTGPLAWDVAVGPRDEILPFISWCEDHQQELMVIWPPRRSNNSMWPLEPKINMEMMRHLRAQWLDAQNPNPDLPIAAPWHRRIEP